MFGLVYVVLAIRESAWCWPAGIANAALFLVAYTQARLYGGAGLQVEHHRVQNIALEQDGFVLSLGFHFSIRLSVVE